MYVGQLAQDDVGAAAEAYAQWFTTVWQAYRNETPPQDLVQQQAWALAQGQISPADVIARLQG